jgi:ubiquinone/menaquinone biosynthesis C-methylase UbiE
VLDIGCGDGRFTANFIPLVGWVLGIDASPSMIESAKQDYGGPKAEFRVIDCRYLEKQNEIVNGTWDKVYAFLVTASLTLNSPYLTLTLQPLQRGASLDLEG